MFRVILLALVRPDTEERTNRPDEAGCGGDLSGATQIEINSGAALGSSSEYGLQRPQHIGGGYDADQLTILDHRKTADLVCHKQVSGFLDRRGRTDRKWMGAHGRLDSRVSQPPHMQACVTVGQNTDSSFLIHHRDLSESASFHPLMCCFQRVTRRDSHRLWGHELGNYHWRSCESVLHLYCNNGAVKLDLKARGLALSARRTAALPSHAGQRRNQIGTGLRSRIRSAPVKLRTSLVPSSISDARASRKIFSIGYSRLSPLPPKICSASEAISNEAWVQKVLAAIAYSRSIAGGGSLCTITARDSARHASTRVNMSNRRFWTS